VVLPEVPRYLWIGKGFAIDPTDMFLVNEAVRMGLLSDYEAAIAVGNYHNGGLSILIPLGVFGLAAFVWMLCAGVKVLYCNHRYGDTRLKSINCLLLSYFVAQSVCYFALFGAFNSQLPIFLGILGLSISFNGGVAKKPAPTQRRIVAAPEMVMAAA
jgi:O-antigen ligase